jgi:hypothetical protein
VKLLLVAMLAASVALGAPSATRAHVGPWRWSVVYAIRTIDHARMKVGARVLRVDSASTLCSGEGSGLRQRGELRWTRFSCTYSAFIGDGIYDCDFRVHVLGPRRFAITQAHWATRAPDDRGAT